MGAMREAGGGGRGRRAGAPGPVLWVLCSLLVAAGCAERTSASESATAMADDPARASAPGAAAAAAPVPVPVLPQTITLTPNTDVRDSEPVTLGIPFAPGALTDAGRVRIVGEDGQEVPAFVRPTLRWHWLDGSIRAVKVQFAADPARAYSFAFDLPRTRSIAERPYDAGTFPGKMGAPVPRVLATLDAAWLVHSRIAGEQLAYDGSRPYDRYVDRQWQWAKDIAYAGTHGFLFDRASVIGFQYVRSGRPEFFGEFYNAATFYLSKIKTGGNGGGWPDCTGGWEFDGVNACDPKYSYLTPQLLLVALAGDDTRLSPATVDAMIENQVKGGWNAPLGPYTGGGQAWTERQVGLALEHLVSGYELTGSPAVRKHVLDVVGWLHDHQQAPPGDPVTGAFTHSWQTHEGADYDPATDVRGSSPWMGANVVGGLWRAWQVTRDPRIPGVLRDYGRYVETHGFVPDDLAGRWRSACNPAEGTIGWYFSSGIATQDRIVAIQDSEGYGSDAHNPELLMVVAAARRFETDPQWRQRFAQRADRLAKFLNPACAASSGTPRAFNWQHRNPESLWLLSQ